jgi:uncharacterized protein (DUF362 family)
MNTVIIRKLQAPHQSESFTKFMPLNPELALEVKDRVTDIFNELGGKTLIKSSRDVYVKPNGIDAKPYCYTRPEVVRAVIEYWFEKGANRVFLLENSTQANYTRVVFEVNGYRKVCRETGAIPVYLDEEKTKSFAFQGKEAVAGPTGRGYDLKHVEMPVTVVEKLINRVEENLYVSLPKLKTHSMSGVTLGIKGQWGFPVHRSRGIDHNQNLHHKLVDVLSYVRPDVTLIEGVEGTIHGHYPATTLADACVKPFRVLIASRNVVAADLVGAKMFGLEKKDVPHLKLAIERGYGGGVQDLGDIHLTGEITSLNGMDLIGDIPESGAYSTDLYDSFPEDVMIIKGSEMACREGCVNNPMTLLQVLYNDHQGKTGWTLVLGKGFDPKEIDAIKGKVLIAGHCAIEEVSDRLIQRLGRKNVYLSGECNDLCSTAEAMFHLMKVNPIHFIPRNRVKAVVAFVLAKMNGSTSRVPGILSHLLKAV